MSKPRRHHYLPQFYLNYFTNNEGIFYIYDEQREEIRQQTPINTALKRDLYVIKQTNGENSYLLEEIFSEYESQAKILFEKIKKQEELCYEEKYIMSFFIALMQTRTPSAIEKTADLFQQITNKHAQIIMQFPEFRKRIDSDREKEGLKAFTDDEYKNICENTHLRINPQYALSASVSKIEKLALIYNQQNWLFLCIDRPDRYFITTDSPFMLARDDADTLLGVAIKGVRKLCPITNKILLVIFDKGDKTIYSNITNKKYIRDLNMFLFKGRKNYVVATEKEQLEYLRKRCGNAKISIKVQVL